MHKSFLRRGMAKALAFALSLAMLTTLFLSTTTSASEANPAPPTVYGLESTIKLNLKANDSDNAQIKQIKDTLSQFSLSIKQTNTQGAGALSATGLFDIMRQSKSVLTIASTVDATGKILLSVPRLTDKPFLIDPAAIMKKANKGSGSLNLAGLKSLTAIKSDDLNASFKGLTDAVMKAMPQAKAGDAKDMKAGQTTMKLTPKTYTLDAKAQKAIVTAACDYLKTDKTFKTVYSALVPESTKKANSEATPSTAPSASATSSTADTSTAPVITATGIDARAFTVPPTAEDYCNNLKTSFTSKDDASISPMTVTTYVNDKDEIFGFDIKSDKTSFQALDLINNDHHDVLMTSNSQEGDLTFTYSGTALSEVNKNGVKGTFTMASKDMFDGKKMFKGTIQDLKNETFKSIAAAHALTGSITLTLEDNPNAPKDEAATAGTTAPSGAASAAPLAPMTSDAVLKQVESVFPIVYTMKKTGDDQYAGSVSVNGWGDLAYTLSAMKPEAAAAIKPVTGANAIDITDQKSLQAIVSDKQTMQNLQAILTDLGLMPTTPSSHPGSADAAAPAATTAGAAAAAPAATTTGASK